MKEFSELNVQPVAQKFIGLRLPVKRILNTKIVVHHFDVKDSKHEKDGKCLYLQIEVDGEKRVLFTRGSYLIKTLEQLNPENDFPFRATIIRKSDNGPYEFT